MPKEAIEEGTAQGQISIVANLMEIAEDFSRESPVEERAIKSKKPAEFSAGFRLEAPGDKLEAHMKNALTGAYRMRLIKRRDLPEPIR